MAYRSSSVSVTNGQGTSGTVPVPTGAAIDDIAIIGASIDNAAGQTFNWGTGFTELRDTDLASPDGHNGSIAWKRLTAADTGNYTVSWTANADYLLQCVLFSGRHTTDPPVAATAATDTNANTSPITVTSNAVTAIDGDDLLWVALPDVTAGNGGTSFSPPTDFTERTDTVDAGTNGWCTMSMATRDNVSAGSTGGIAGTFVASSTAGWVAHLVRIPTSAAPAAGQPTSKRHGGVPFVALPGRGNVWAPVFRQLMLIGPSSSIRKAA